MGMMMAIGSPSGSLYLAKGRADVGFWYNVVNTAVVVAALYAAVHYGTRAVSASQSLVAVAMMPLELYLLWRLSRLRPLSYLRCLAAPLLSAGLMGACVYATYLGLREPAPRVGLPRRPGRGGDGHLRRHMASDPPRVHPRPLAPVALERLECSRDARTGRLRM